jgi:hypothetical protein
MKGGFLKFDKTINQWINNYPYGTPKHEYSESEKHALEELILNNTNLKTFWTMFNVNDYDFSIEKWMRIKKHLQEACRVRKNEAIQTYKINPDKYIGIDYSNNTELITKDKTHLDYYFLLIKARDNINDKIKDLIKEKGNQKQDLKENTKQDLKEKKNHYLFDSDSDSDSDSEPIPVKPISNKPVNSEPVKPISNKPVNSEPIPVKPISNKPVNSEPISNKPVNSEPISNKPVNSEPVKPISNKPANSNQVKPKSKKQTRKQSKALKRIDENNSKQSAPRRSERLALASNSNPVAPSNGPADSEHIKQPSFPRRSERLAKRYEIPSFKYPLVNADGEPYVIRKTISKPKLQRAKTISVPRNTSRKRIRSY